MIRFAALLVAALCASVVPVAAETLPERPAGPAAHAGPPGATVLIIRHAEKPEFGVALAADGEARARAYVGYFADLKVKDEPIHVDQLVAAGDSFGSIRPRMTLMPLSRAMHLPIESSFKNADVAGVTDWLRRHAANRTVLVAWHHGRIPELVAALGADPESLLAYGRWPDDVYDQVVVIRFDADGHVIPGRTGTVHEDLALFSGAVQRFALAPTARLAASAQR